jgi:hypothetical protein
MYSLEDRLPLSQDIEDVDFSLQQQIRQEYNHIKVHIKYISYNKPSRKVTIL